MYRALRRFGLDADEAGDVAQEVFLRAWRGLDRFEGRSQLSTWLYRIAFNEAQRRLSRRRPAPRCAADPDGPDPIAAIPDSPEHEPDARALERELGEAVDAALSQLPPALRAAVILRDLEGLSTDEAAAVAGVRPAAFKSRLHRGRLALRPLLAPYLDSGARRGRGPAPNDTQLVAAQVRYDRDHPSIQMATTPAGRMQVPRPPRPPGSRGRSGVALLVRRGDVLVGQLDPDAAAGAAALEVALVVVLGRVERTGVGDLGHDRAHQRQLLVVT